MARKLTNRPPSKDLNVFAPTKPHAGQLEVLTAIDEGQRFILLRAGRKFRKTSLMISRLVEGALETGLVYPYIAPNKMQAKNIAWNDHVTRLLDHFKEVGLQYKTNEQELSITFPNGGKVQLYGVENKEALRGISNWGGIACFVGETLIDTPNGRRRIDSLRRGDFVLTPQGKRKVLRAGETKRTNRLVEITLSSGEVIVCTPEHHIFTDSGLVRADELRYTDVVWTKHQHPQLPSTALSFGYKRVMGMGTTAPESAAKNGTYTARSGLISLGGFQLAGLSTTKTMTSLTIGQRTWFVSPPLNIPAHMSATVSGRTLRLFGNESQEIFHSSLPTPEVNGVKPMPVGTLNWLKKKLVGGTAPATVNVFTQNWLKKPGQIGNTLQNFVNNVVTSIRPPTQSAVNSAPRVVEINHIETEETPVYDLTVNVDHCYYANGVLVSNCDEYDDWMEDIWPLIIRPNLIPHKAWAIIGGTPKGKRGMWRLSRTNIFKEFHFSSYTNPDLSAEELRDLESEYKAYGEDFYQQEIMAEYIKPVGVVYKEFNEEVQVRKDINYESNLPLEVWWDFGINDPTAMIWVQPAEGELRVIDYYEASNVSINHFVQVLNSKPYGTPSKHVGDIAGRSRSLTSGTSAVEELDKLGVFMTTNSIPDITSQVRITHKYVPQLFIKDSPNTERFIDVINNYRYPDAKKENAPNQSNELPMHDQYSHGARAFEYGCWELDQKMPARFKPKREKRYDEITGRVLS